MVTDYQTNFLSYKFSKKQDEEIIIKNYLITENVTCYIKYMSLDMCETNQGFFPLIKTLEANPEDTSKYIKVLKIYSQELKIIKQIIVDDPIFKNYSFSILKFENCLFFYKRIDKYFKLHSFDLVNQ